MRRAVAPILAISGLAIGLAPRPAPPEPPRPTLTEEQRAIALEMSPLPPPPPDPTNRVADDDDAAALGQFLFFDERLSANGQVSCATCHVPTHGFGDPRRLPMGLMRGERHAQSLWNVAYADWFFWDGRADSLWSQALKPLERDIEMGSSRLAVAHVLHDDPALREAYEAVFGPMPDLDDLGRFPAAGAPSVNQRLDAPWRSMAHEDQRAIDRVFANVGKALAAYQRRLVSRRSDFDVFVEGLREGDPAKQAALDDEALRGFGLFVGKANCRLCHAGPNFSDGHFHNNRVPPLGGGLARDPGRFGAAAALRRDPFNAAGPHSDDPELGGAVRLGALHAESHDWGLFKTPTLRNVALSPPYMHQGQLDSLEDVVRYYSTLGGALPTSAGDESVLLPLGLSDTEVHDLVAFLRALTDADVDPTLLEPPASPMPTRDRPPTPANR